MHCLARPDKGKQILNFKLWPLVFGFLFFAVAVTPANALPTAEDINDLAQKTQLTTNTFMRDSFELRMAYEYAGRFTNPDDKNKLHNLTKKAT